MPPTLLFNPRWSGRAIANFGAALLLMQVAPQASASLAPPSGFPEVFLAREESLPVRGITADDLLSIRELADLTVAPDGRHYAVLVRRADLPSDTYRDAWYAGEVGTLSLTFLADAGNAERAWSSDGTRLGIGASQRAWAPDSKAFAFVASLAGKRDLWVVNLSAREPRRISNVASDVVRLAWQPDSLGLLFEAREASRDTERSAVELERRNGLRLSRLQTFSQLISGAGLPAGATKAWSTRLDDGSVRVATPEEALRLQSSNVAVGSSNAVGARPVAATLPVSSDRGILPRRRVQVTKAGMAAQVCRVSACIADRFIGVWQDSFDTTLFGRSEGANRDEDAFYAWHLKADTVEPLFRDRDHKFFECSDTVAGLLCITETPTRPKHLVMLSRDGSLAELADPNPEFAKIRLGRVERFDINFPSDPYRMGYTKQGRGYIIYPPDFDPKQKYPAIIAPYYSGGFLRGDVGNEQPLFLYASSGFIVIKSEFPSFWGLLERERTNAGVMAKAYSLKHGFPHMSALLETTLRALRIVEQKGVVDSRRVGIGGISQASVTSLYMLQKYDLLAAVSVGTPAWSQDEYYGTTKNGRLDYWGGKDPWPEDRSYWAHIDLADHVKSIEAPILFNLPDAEAFRATRLIRKLDDNRIPYDAYIYGDEDHLKWYPSHILSIYRRNLAWFLFWLQGAQGLKAAEASQLRAWDKLRSELCAGHTSHHWKC